MYVVAVVLAGLSALFYVASQHQLGAVGADVCQYGSLFCDKPHYMMTGALLAALWGKFVSMR
ncbi:MULTISPECIES: hypothetical protein [unclassified Bradyrhizobium]|uniref:hypothetical protein n=1 Tax=Bradyrhizobium TaxID=374 RepID=UPI0028F0121D|nr:MULTISPECIES: hypothetical protein [unclassified Bradyrhizobium]